MKSLARRVPLLVRHRVWAAARYRRWRQESEYIQRLLIVWCEFRDEIAYICMWKHSLRPTWQSTIASHPAPAPCLVFFDAPIIIFHMLAGWQGRTNRGRGVCVCVRMDLDSVRLEEPFFRHRHPKEGAILSSHWMLGCSILCAEWNPTVFPTPIDEANARKSETKTNRFIIFDAEIGDALFMDREKESEKIMPAGNVYGRIRA